MIPEEQATWSRALRRSREEKDRLFHSEHDSPLPFGDRARLAGLKYFDPDSSYRFEAKLQRDSNPVAVMMATSKGTRQLFNRVGYFELNIMGRSIHLHAYQSAERVDPNLFIPFRDLTSGKETYDSARYLDLKVEHDDDYVVDFNKAYNPYCAYSEDFVCPLPPTENWLNASIRAGEKKYHI
jgi:uncharacterized protein